MFRKSAVSAIAVLASLTAAQAADMGVKAPIYKAVPMAYNWTGFYAGAFVGVGLNHSHGFDPTGADTGAIDFLGTGFTGGIAAGYNYQVAPNWVVGIEGDIGYLGLSHHVQQYNEANLAVNSKASWVATLRGRIGYTTGPTLRYVTGGVAFVDTQDVVTTLAGVGGTESKVRSGYALGTGVETMLGGNWTAKMEALYVDVGGGSAQTGAGFVLQTDKHQYLMQRFGLNYAFGGPRAAALPASNWGGAYVGVLAGAVANQTRVIDPTAGLVGEFGNHGTGATLGGLIGYNWHVSPSWVVGVEGDISWAGINHSVDDFNDSLALYTVKTNWLATVRGRIGYSTGPALLYVTAGGAWVNARERWDFGSGPVAIAKTLSGYTIGAGIESRFAGNWTARTEYLFVDVGNGPVLVDPSVTPIRGDHQYHVFRSSLIYNFNSPIVAKY